MQPMVTECGNRADIASPQSRELTQRENNTAQVPFMTARHFWKQHVSSTLSRKLTAASRRVTDLLIPPRCPITDEIIAHPGELSATGWRQIDFIDAPFCPGCSLPFQIPVGDHMICALCLADTHEFDRARAAIVYNDTAHELILAFKSRDHTELAPLFHQWLRAPLLSLISAGCILIPVPLHPQRLKSRRYNQAAILAQGLARDFDLPLETQWLLRTKSTPPQKALSATARIRNVAGAFQLTPEARERTIGKHFILVDDVMTTGSTLSTCAKVLKSAGAKQVDALVVARVVKDSGSAI